MNFEKDVENYEAYLKIHSQLHMVSRHAHLCKYIRLPYDTDIATLNAQLTELRNVVCRK